MLIIVSTHPIQYQVPLWQALAKDGRVPFEVWYLTHHGVNVSLDPGFGKSFAWDLDMLSGYPNRLLKGGDRAGLIGFLKCRLTDPIGSLLREKEARAVWVQGWQVLAYWQVVWAAKRADCRVWLRGESNDLAPIPLWKGPIKRAALSMLFHRVDLFLYIGSANRRLYKRFGIGEDRLLAAPYAVDNERFAKQAADLRELRRQLRTKWGIAEDAMCVLFCGKFIEKKRPMDLVEAARRALRQAPRIHLLFAGAGELGGELRTACDVVFDAEAEGRIAGRSWQTQERPRASFVGFLNQTKISEAYVAADCMVLPSDYGETWGLVVNEAMASGLPCIVSDRCGCAEDLGTRGSNSIFPFGAVERLSELLSKAASCRNEMHCETDLSNEFSFDRTVESIVNAYERDGASSKCKA